MAIASGAFCLVGACLMGLWAVPATLRHLATRSWIEAQCTILETSVEVRTDEDGDTYAPRFSYRYELGNHRYENLRYDMWNETFADRNDAEAIVARFPQGTVVPCYFDPADHDESVLERRSVPVGALSFFAALALGGIAMLAAGLVFGRRARRPPSGGVGRSRQ